MSSEKKHRLPLKQLSDSGARANVIAKPQIIRQFDRCDCHPLDRAKPARLAYGVFYDDYEYPGAEEVKPRLTTGARLHWESWLVERIRTCQPTDADGVNGENRK